MGKSSKKKHNRELKLSLGTTNPKANLQWYGHVSRKLGARVRIVMTGRHGGRWSGKGLPEAAVDR